MTLDAGRTLLLEVDDNAFFDGLRIYRYEAQLIYTLDDHEEFKIAATLTPARWASAAPSKWSAPRIRGRAERPLFSARVREQRIRRGRDALLALTLDAPA